MAKRRFTFEGPFGTPSFIPLFMKKQLLTALALVFFTVAASAQQEFQQAPLDLSAWPNPVNDLLEITADIGQSTDLWFTISGSTGEIIRRELWKNSSGSFNRTVSVGDYPSGTYTIHLNDGNNQVFKRIIIFH